MNKRKKYKKRTNRRSLKKIYKIKTRTMLSKRRTNKRSFKRKRKVKNKRSLKRMNKMRGGFPKIDAERALFEGSIIEQRLSELGLNPRTPEYKEKYIKMLEKLNSQLESLKNVRYRKHELADRDPADGAPPRGFLMA